MKAMILAAGLGIRLQPLTNEKPKALIEVGGYTMLELAIKYLKKNGFKEIVINVHHFADQIVEYINKNNRFGIDISFSDERNQLLDTGGAIVHASSYFDGPDPFLVMGVDILTDLDLNSMIQNHLKKKPLVSLAVKNRQTSRPLLFDENMQLVGWRNITTGQSGGNNIHNAAHALGFSVIHIIQPEIFGLIEEKGAFPIFSLYLRLMDTQKIIGFRHDEGSWLEFGRMDRIAKHVKSKEFQLISSSF